MANVARSEAAGPELPKPADERGGWGLIWALSAAQLVSWGTVYEGFSLFVVPMQAELGWSRTAMNGALSLGLLTSGLCAYSVGAWVDRHGGRAVMTIGSALAAACLAVWSRIDSLVVLYLIWFGLGMAMSATLYEPAFAIITRRFPHTFRSRITAMTLVGGFASTIFIPLTQFLIEALGWRDALVALAFFNVLIGVPIHALFLRDGTARRGMKGAPDPEMEARNRDAVRRAFRSPVFWGLAISFTAYSVAFSALFFHLIPLLHERGFSAAVIVGALALRGPAQVAARFAMLAFGRYMHTAVVGRIVILALPVSILLLILWPASAAALFAFILFYGAANGMMTIIRGTAVADLLGRDGYGAINGALTLPANIGRAAAPFGAALIWDVTGDYGAVLWTIAAGGAIAAAAFWFAAGAAARSRPELRP